MCSPQSTMTTGGSGSQAKLADPVSCPAGTLPAWRFEHGPPETHRPAAAPAGCQMDMATAMSGLSFCRLQGHLRALLQWVQLCQTLHLKIPCIPQVDLAGHEAVANHHPGTHHKTADLLLFQGWSA